MEEENTIRSSGRRRWVAVVLTVCVLVGIGVVAFWPGEREPEYNGKKLSEWGWLAQGCTINGESGQEPSFTAINRIGTNALPFLIKWLRYDHPTSAEKIADQFWRWMVALHICHEQRSWMMPFPRSEVAVWIFDVLKTNGAPAIPALRNLLRDPSSSPNTIRATADSLACIGESGLREVTAFLRERGQPNRMYALESLATMRQNAAPPLDALTEFIQDPEERVAVEVAKKVSVLGWPESERRVAILMKGAEDPRAAVRRASITSLTNFPNAYPAVPELIHALGDLDPETPTAASNALSTIAPEVLTNGVKGF